MTNSKTMQQTDKQTTNLNQPYTTKICGLKWTKSYQLAALLACYRIYQSIHNNNNNCKNNNKTDNKK